MAKKKAAKKTAAKKTAKKKAAKKPAKAASAKEPVIVASKIKAAIKSHGMMTASDSLAVINDKIYAMLEEAVKRAQANRRSTVKPQDL